MPSLESIKKAPRADGFASILAIGRANPENFIEQSAYPDLFFRITKSEHLVDLKNKFKRICDKTAIRKRHFVWTEEFITANPCFSTFMEKSLNIRQEVAIREIPKLGAEAAAKAIQEWGQPKSRITHLIFCTRSGMGLPGPDYQLTQILGLNPNVERVMIYQQGCFAGGTTLRLAKCLAESHKGVRVLVVCAETTTVLFRAPSKEHQEDLVTQALFADGASALIVGADPDETADEHASFVIVSTSQVLLPESAGAIGGHVPHPGGRAILDQLDERVGLKPEKLFISRHVLKEYGNMSSASVHFALDEMSKWSAKEGKGTTGEGLEWGVLFGFGPGVTVETVVLRSVHI
ncbi:hypothetical protein KFK09_027145 [Dendrobium nobile]|uniref:chalcone synthase n=1 Tax=Dendrobium nobile TaxID=94219 RepID=A0A8T3A9T0_DENNO|nr:hypothetical protein KFK09_027145 [Dendrobium nobile]